MEHTSASNTGMAVSDGACLVLFSQEFGDHVYPLTTPLMTMGRSPACHVCLPDQRLAELHAEVVRYKDRWILRRLGESNATTVNGRPVREQVLRPDDRIDLGGVATLYFSQQCFAA